MLKVAGWEWSQRRPKPAASAKMPTSTPTMAKLWAAIAASHLVRDRPEDLEIVCKAFPVRNGPGFAKAAFTLDVLR